MALSAAPNLACAQAPQTAEAALPDDQTFDVVVAGATPGGIACAVRAAREGLSVLLVDHSQHLGGILSNGLGVWDTQYEGRRSPIYDETRAGIMAFYRQTYGENSPQYQGARPGASGHTNGRVEPRVFEKFVTDLVAKEPNIRVVTGFYATEARRAGRTVEALRFARTEGATDSFWAKAKVFVDCTYEGDALAAMKLAYLVGRESLDKWNEPHAGHLWMKKIEPRVHDKPEVDLRKFNEDQIKLPQSTGVGDDRVQAYNLRVILSSDPNNQVAVTKPANYDVAALRKLDDSSIVRGLPNDKVCWNRPQLIGLQNAYPEGDWKTRAAITLAHREAAQGLLWYLQNDPGVPADKQREWKRWGLARDEFGDNDHWPRELYVREARRLDGRATFTQHDAMLAEGISRAPIHGDSIAVTEWYMDTHATGTQTVNGSLMEGKMMLHAETVPGQISYQTLLPREVDNVLVPVCASFTHVAWGTVRLEPTWMNIAEAAAFACAQAVKTKVAPAQIDVDALQRTLADNRVMISFFNDCDLGSDAAWVAAAQYCGTKGVFAAYNTSLEKTLTPVVAAQWAQTAGQIVKKQGEPTQRALALQEAVYNPKFDRLSDVSAVNFAAMLAKATATGPRAAQLLKELKLEGQTALSRGDACRLIYGVTRKTK